MNAALPVPQGQTDLQSSLSNYGDVALAAELTKMLQLVAPISMSAEDRAAWTMAAIDALEDIRADEVRAISAELRRSVTRHNQIVPEIARLVAEKRARSQRAAAPENPLGMAEWRINTEAARRRSLVSAKDKRALSEIYEWERQARIDAGLHVPPYPKPLTAAEIEAMPAHIRKLGFAHGFLTKRNGQVVEA